MLYEKTERREILAGLKSGRFGASAIRKDRAEGNSGGAEKADDSELVLYEKTERREILAGLKSGRFGASAIRKDRAEGNSGGAEKADSRFERCRESC